MTYTLANGGPTINWGSWAALDPRTGRILWQVPDPTPGTVDPGAVSVANGVLYAGSVLRSDVRARRAERSCPFHLRQRWLGYRRTVNCEGNRLLGLRYRNIPPGIGNNKVFAFTLPKAGK